MRSKRIIRYFLCCSCTFLLSGCGSKPIAYMKYGEKSSKEISYRLDRNDKEADYDLMATDLTLLSSTSVNLLNNSPNFNADAIFVSNETKHQTVFSQNVSNLIYPASLTKLMTAYVALKHGGDLSKEFIVTDEARKITIPYAKLMGLLENDHISLETLLNATLVHSSNDAAKSLAIAVAGSEEEFVKLMNQEAIHLGAIDTHFTNPHGLHDKAHYTTLYDLYLIFHALLKDERFVKIIGQKEYIATYQNGLGGRVQKTLLSTNQYLLGNFPLPNGYTIFGGKTGTTNEAGYCMMIYASSTSGERYIIGIMKASDTLNLYAGFSSIFENMP